MTIFITLVYDSVPHHAKKSQRGVSLSWTIIETLHCFRLLWNRFQRVTRDSSPAVHVLRGIPVRQHCRVVQPSLPLQPGGLPAPAARLHGRCRCNGRPRVPHGLANLNTSPCSSKFWLSVAISFRLIAHDCNWLTKLEVIGQNLHFTRCSQIAILVHAQERNWLHAYLNKTLLDLKYESSILSVQEYCPGLSNWIGFDLIFDSEVTESFRFDFDLIKKKIWFHTKHISSHTKKLEIGKLATS